MIIVIYIVLITNALAFVFLLFRVSQHQLAKRHFELYRKNIAKVAHEFKLDSFYTKNPNSHAVWLLLNSLHKQIYNDDYVHDFKRNSKQTEVEE